MNEAPNFEELVRDPVLLVELIEDILAQFGICDNASDLERDAQLKEISKTIERLQNMGVCVPDVLRAEKLRLSCTSGLSKETATLLQPLADGLDEILRTLKKSLGQQYSRTGTQDGQKMNVSARNAVDYVTNARASRISAGMNQSAFWARFGVTQSGGSRYESGREISGPTQILMMLYALSIVNDDDLMKVKMALGSEFKQSSE